MSGRHCWTGLVVAVFLAATTGAGAIQSLGVLRVSVVVTGRDQQVTPIHRHALLISDNPSTAPPRRILTQADGTVEVRLPPGNYTIESDQPLRFEGQAYAWTQMVDVVAGRDTLLELTAANAAVDAADAGTAAKEDPELYAKRWLEGVAGIWTATTHASASLVNVNGLLVTSQRLIGDATAVEVQLTPAVKVHGVVLAADAARDVAVVRIDPATAALVRPVPFGCDAPPASTLRVGQAIVALEVPLRRARGATSGAVTRISGTGIESDLVPESGGAGGPVFSTTGAPLGIVSIGDENGRGGHAPIVPLSDVCAVVAVAETAMRAEAPPSGARLPVEPTREFPARALNDAQLRSTAPSQISATDFEITFLTPPQVSVARNRGVTDYRNWDEYVGDVLPVVLVRATPKLVEGFWAKVARGAILTQGVALPAFRRPKTGFLAMRAFCGQTEVTPIHPLKLEYRLSASERVFEGLYVYPHDAFPPSCDGVRLELVSEKEPAKADTRVVDPGVIRQIWQDFASFRATP